MDYLISKNYFCKMNKHSQVHPQKGNGINKIFK